MGKGKNGCDGDMAMSSILGDAPAGYADGPGGADYAPYGADEEMLDFLEADPLMAEARPAEKDLGEVFKPSELPPVAARAWKLRMSGRQVADIATKLGVSESTVYRHIREIRHLGGSKYEAALANLPEPHPHWLPAAIQDYWLEGKSLRDIGRRSGLNKETVRQWLIRANIERRPPAAVAPQRFVHDPDTPEVKEAIRMLKEQNKLHRKMSGSSYERIVQGNEDTIKGLQVRTEHSSYVDSGPFADEKVLETIVGDLVKRQEATKDIISEFQWEHVTATAFKQHYDDAYVMESPSHPGRDVEVVNGRRRFGISNKSERHKDVSEDSETFRVSHFMYYNGYDDFAEKVKEHVSDYDYALNLRVYEDTYPGTGEPAMCYRVYKIPNEVLEAAGSRSYLSEGTTTVRLDDGWPMKVRRYGAEVKIENIPMSAVEIQAAFWVPLPQARGKSEG